MSVRAMTWAFDRQDIESTDKLVLLCLADHADSKGACWPSVKTLAEKASLHPGTIRRRLRNLQDKGFICIEDRESKEGRTTSNMYVLKMEGDPSTALGGTLAESEGDPSTALGGTLAEDGGSFNESSVKNHQENHQGENARGTSADDRGDPGPSPQQLPPTPPENERSQIKEDPDGLDYMPQSEEEQNVIRDVVECYRETWGKPGYSPRHSTRNQIMERHREFRQRDIPSPHQGRPVEFVISKAHRLYDDGDDFYGDNCALATLTKPGMFEKTFEAQGPNGKAPRSSSRDQLMQHIQKAREKNNG